MNNPLLSEIQKVIMKTFSDNKNDLVMLINKDGGQVLVGANGITLSGGALVDEPVRTALYNLIIDFKLMSICNTEPNGNQYFCLTSLGKRWFDSPQED